ncbi:M14 family metallopeptidase [Anaerobacillus isosaccharinicus]|uniref:LysM peptidoglycan-binding domain-containing protein n=1 Tax=Anaerobacillus isosaccharinicus TaxID=1532552 RepID=A0A1S2KXG6_9BACI|nr:M14 family metallopeptidase [Anaerobacillus isosaccharinicus]MBA5586868.1 LysM peptidoglycan-binding domain-containing protein [Anaerobacillus isosaccharinicus]QOY34921.1 LysM peptidoglycan-binding domain-containing protein [Anaerobacillus isosaccharinicus]
MNIRVRQGDNFWYYSRLFTIPLPLILDSNPNVNPVSLQVGQIVRIPGYFVNFYTIQAGDTFWSVSNRLGFNFDMLQLLNLTLNPYGLQIGQRINVPVRVQTPIVRGKRSYEYATLLNEIRQLVEIYPFIKRRTIGNSVMGKDIVELQVGRGSKKVHMNGSFHAHEWITTPILMQTLNEYLLALTNMGSVREIFMPPYYDAVLLSIVPMVNPDGVDLVIRGVPEEEPYRSDVLAINRGSTNFSGWKANIHGVDLNNQYPALWDVEAARKPSQPARRDFPGFQPLSEPEAIAMANLTREENFDRVLAYHTQGKVIFWGFQGMEPPEAETIVNEFARVSGFRAVRYVDSFAGYKDWFIQEWRKPGYTVELGRGINPLPISQFDEIYQDNLGIFLASLYM